MGRRSLPGKGHDRRHCKSSCREAAELTGAPRFDWPDRNELVHPLHDAGHARQEARGIAVLPLLYVRPVASEVSLDRGYLLETKRGGRVLHHDEEEAHQQHAVVLREEASSTNLRQFHQKRQGMRDDEVHIRGQRCRSKRRRSAAVETKAVSRACCGSKPRNNG